MTAYEEYLSGNLVDVEYPDEMLEKGYETLPMI
jgi:hypothetical protein